MKKSNNLALNANLEHASHRSPKNLISSLYSIWFTVLLTAAVFTLWFFNLGVYGLCAFGILLGLLLALVRDVSCVVPIIFLIPQIMRTNTVNEQDSVYLIIAVSALGLGLIVRFFRFRPKLKDCADGYIVSLAFCGIAVCLGGITLSAHRQPLPATLIALYGLATPLIGVTFYHSLGKTERTKNVLFYAVFSSAVLACFQLLTLILLSPDPIKAVSSKYALDPGYANVNYVANIISRAIPLCIYLASKEQKGSKFWFLVAYIFGFCILLTSSRNSLLVGGVVAVIAVVYFAFKTKDKVSYLCVTAIFLGITLILAAIMKSKFSQYFGTLTKMKFDSNGRFDLWKTGIERFKSHPIFGVGFDYDLGGRIEYPGTQKFTPYWYHNTVVQILACTGIFGLLCYAAYFFQTYKTLFKVNSGALKAVGFIILTIHLSSMLDVFFFTPQEYIELMIMTIICKKLGSERGRDTDGAFINE